MTHEENRPPDESQLAIAWQQQLYGTPFSSLSESERTDIFMSGDIGLSMASPLLPTNQPRDMVSEFEKGMELLAASGLVAISTTQNFFNAAIPYNDRTTEIRLAEGAFYRVSCQRLHYKSYSKLVAVKHMKLPTNGNDSEQSSVNRLHTISRDIDIMTRERFRSMGGHPLILHCLGFGWEIIDNKPRIFLVVDYAPHGTFRDLLRSQVLDIDTKLCLLKDICAGIGSLHSDKIAHGDVKLDNVLVFDSSKNSELKANYPYHGEHPEGYPKMYAARLTDFGSSINGLDGVYSGTRLYHAPEVQSELVNNKLLEGSDDRFLRCDVWSIGLLLLEVLNDGVSWSQSHELDETLAQECTGILGSVLEQIDQGNWTIAVTTQSLIRKIFEMTLQCNPELRSQAVQVVKIIALSSFHEPFFKDLLPKDIDLDSQSVLILDGYPTLDFKGPGTGTQENILTHAHFGDDLDSLHELRAAAKVRTTESNGSQQQTADKSLSLMNSSINLPAGHWESMYRTKYEEAMRHAPHSGKAVSAANYLVLMWTLKTARLADPGGTLDEFIDLLETLLMRTEGTAAAWIYVRLLHALGRERSTLSIPSERIREILQLEEDALKIDTEDYHYERTMSCAQSAWKDVFYWISWPLTAKPAIEIKSSVQLRPFLQEHINNRGLFRTYGLMTLLALSEETDILRYVLKREPFLCRILPPVEVGGVLPILSAARIGNFENVKAFVELGDLDPNVNPFPNGFTPLHYLAMMRREDVEPAAKLLLDYGCCLDTFADHDRSDRLDYLTEVELFGTPLHFAIACGRQDVVKILLDLGADVNFVPNIGPARGINMRSMNIILFAAHHRQAIILSMLLTHEKSLRPPVSPFRVLACELPMAQLLRHGQKRVQRLLETINLLQDQGYNIGEELETVPSLDYSERLSIFERCMLDDNITGGFDLFQCLLDTGCQPNWDSENVKNMKTIATLIGKNRHQVDQKRFLEWLIDHDLLVPSKVLIVVFLAKGMDSCLGVILNALPNAFIGASTTNEYPGCASEEVSLLLTAIELRASEKTIELLLDYRPGLLSSGSLSKEEEHAILYHAVLTCNGELLDLLFDRTGGFVQFDNRFELLLASNIIIQGRHTLSYLLRFKAEKDLIQGPIFRHPEIVAHVNDVGPAGKTLLQMALERLNVDVVLALLDAGARVDAKMCEKAERILISHSRESVKQPMTAVRKGFKGPRELQACCFKLCRTIGLHARAKHPDIPILCEIPVSLACLLWSTSIVIELVEAGFSFIDTWKDMPPVVWSRTHRWIATTREHPSHEQIRLFAELSKMLLFLTYKHALAYLAEPKSQPGSFLFWYEQICEAISEEEEDTYNAAWINYLYASASNNTHLHASKDNRDMSSGVSQGSHIRSTRENRGDDLGSQGTSLPVSKSSDILREDDFVIMQRLGLE